MPRRVVKVRHLYRCKVVEPSWCVVSRRYTRFQPLCVCGWAGDEVTDRTLSRALWKLHRDAEEGP